MRDELALKVEGELEIVEREILNNKRDASPGPKESAAGALKRKREPTDDGAAVALNAPEPQRVKLEPDEDELDDSPFAVDSEDEGEANRIVPVSEDDE